MEPLPLTTLDGIDMELGQLLPTLDVEDLDYRVLICYGNLLEICLDGLHSGSAGQVAVRAQVRRSLETVIRPRQLQRATARWA